MSEGEVFVTGLYKYPIKGCEAMPVEHLIFNLNDTLKDDHYWMVVERETGVFISARSHPHICLVRVGLSSGYLGLSAHGVLGLVVHFKDGHKVTNVTLHNETFSAIDCGNNAAEWLSRFLGTNCRLVRVMGHARERMMRTAGPVDLDSEELLEISFADDYPVLLTSEASLATLNRHMGKELSMLRFRPNVIVSGCEPFEEDNWRDMLFNGTDRFSIFLSTQLRGLKRCTRCTVPSVNPLTGEVDEKGILKALGEMGRVLPEYPDRPNSKRGAAFGISCMLIPESEGLMISLGDRLEVISRWN